MGNTKNEDVVAEKGGRRLVERSIDTYITMDGRVVTVTNRKFVIEEYSDFEEKWFVATYTDANFEAQPCEFGDREIAVMYFNRMPSVKEEVIMSTE